MVIFQPLVYLVSFILKVWHLFLAQVLHLSASLAWSLSIVLLVVTVRIGIYYFSYQQSVTARKAAILRPQLQQLQQFYSRHGDPNAPEYAAFAQRQLREEHGLKSSALLVPIFIQLPIIFGLVSMLRQMLSAASAPGEPAAFGVGVISAAEVTDFLQATIGGRPLPAYLNMPADRFELLGITWDYLALLCIPGIIIAALFTGFNLAVSSARTQRTLDYSNGVALFLARFLRSMIIIAPLLLLFFGFFGPTAVALIAYWLCNNLWTLGQNIYLTRYVEKRYPLTDAFLNMQEGQKQEYAAAMADKHVIKKLQRNYRWRSILKPWRSATYREAFAAEKAQVVERRQQIQAKQQAQALQVARVRYTVGQMRPGAQDALPSLGGAMPINADNVPPLPGVQKAREEMLRQYEKAKSRPKAVLIMMYLAQSAGKGAKVKLQKLTGREPSRWKRFRD